MLPTTNIPTPLETLRAKINETHWIEGVKEVVNGLISVVEKQNQELLALQSLLDLVLAENPELRSKKKSSEQEIMSPSEMLKELDRLHKDQQFETLRYDYPGQLK